MKIKKVVLCSVEKSSVIAGVEIFGFLENCHFFGSSPLTFKNDNNNFLLFQAALTGSSFRIYTWLSGQVLIGSVTVQVPDTWTSIECGVDLTESYNVGVG